LKDQLEEWVGEEVDILTHVSGEKVSGVLTNLEATWLRKHPTEGQLYTCYITLTRKDL